MACQSTKGQTTREPICITDIPPNAWHTLSFDFYSGIPTGKELLVINDVKSKYIIVAECASTSFANVKPKLLHVFRQYGLPYKIRSDNAPPFNGSEFAVFCQNLGINHQKVTPEHPEANGEVESFMKSITKCLQCANIEKNLGSKSWQTCSCCTGPPHILRPRYHQQL